MHRRFLPDFCKIIFYYNIQARAALLQNAFSFPRGKAERMTLPPGNDAGQRSGRLCMAMKHEDPMRRRAYIKTKSFFLTILRTHMEISYVSETYDCFHFRSMSSMAAHFPFFSEKEWKVRKGRNRRPVIPP